MAKKSKNKQTKENRQKKAAWGERGSETGMRRCYG